MLVTGEKVVFNAYLYSCCCHAMWKVPVCEVVGVSLLGLATTCVSVEGDGGAARRFNDYKTESFRYLRACTWYKEGLLLANFQALHVLFNRLTFLLFDTFSDPSAIASTSTTSGGSLTKPCQGPQVSVIFSSAGGVPIKWHIERYASATYRH